MFEHTFSVVDASGSLNFCFNCQPVVQKTPYKKKRSINNTYVVKFSDSLSQMISANLRNHIITI